MNSASPELIACYLLAQAGLPLPIKAVVINPPKPGQQPRA